jgi:phage-related protein
LKDDVKQKWDELKENTAAKWNEIKDSVENKVSDAANAVKEKWNGLKDTTSKVWGAMKDKVNENGGGIKGIVKTYAEGWQNIIKFAWNTADKATGGALSNMLTSVIDKAKDIKENIENKIGEAVDFIKNLPSQALQWGKDLIANFVDGIKNAPANIASAASGIAGTVADFLHFSEPDKGPLKDFHTFAPDMVRLFAQGMEQTLPVLERASADFASALVPGAMQNGGGATTTYNTPVNITVYGAEGQDVNALADVIQARLNREVMNQKAVFA